MSGVSFTPDVWQHIAFAKNGSTVKAYRNGIEVYSKTFTGSVVTYNNDELYVGSARMYTSRSFVGSLDELAIFSRPLTPAQISELYARGAASVSLQVRSCMGSCTEAVAYVGPKATPSFFSEALSSSLVPLTNAILDEASTGLHDNKTTLQYQMIMSSDDAAVRPLIPSVSFGPDRYDTLSPTVIPQHAQAYSTLIGFSATAGPGNAGSFSFQVSPDAGVTWYFYNGTAWQITAAGASESSTAASIHSHVSTLPMGTKAFVFKAFMTASSSSQQAVLSPVTLDYVP